MLTFAPTEIVRRPNIYIKSTCNNATIFFFYAHALTIVNSRAITYKRIHASAYIRYGRVCMKHFQIIFFLRACHIKVFNILRAECSYKIFHLYLNSHLHVNTNIQYSDYLSISEIVGVRYGFS